MPYNVRLPNGYIVQDIPDDVSHEEARAQIMQAFPELGAKEKRTWGEAATDTLASLGKGVGQLAQLPGQVGTLLGLSDPNRQDVGLQGLGQDLEQFSESYKSPVLKAKEAVREQKIAKAEGLLPEFGTAIKETIKDPALLTSFFAEQIPNLIGSWGGGALAKGTTKALMATATEEALAKAGVRGAIATGAIQQGADIGSDTYQAVYKEAIKQGMSDEDAQGTALAKARVAALEAAGISLASTKLPGGASIERAMVGKGLPGAGGFLKGMSGEALSEAVEEGGGAFAKNVGLKEVNPETDLLKGVGAAAGMGALGGALFGGPAGVVNAKFDAAEKAKVIEFEDQRQATIQAIEEAKVAEDQARRDAHAAENEAIKMRAIMESGSITESKAYAELEEKVAAIQEKAAAAKEKADAIRDKADAEKAKFSAFYEAEPDLFGKVYPQIHQVKNVEQTTQVNESQPGQMELPLTDEQGQLGLEGVGIAQPRQPASVTEAPQGRPVTEADFKAMGVGASNKTLRAEILGKDLTDPKQAAEVRAALENYASGDRSAKIIKGVESFLALPDFQEQQKLSLRRPYGSMKKPVPETLSQEEQAGLQQELDMELGQEAPAQVATPAPAPAVQAQAKPTPVAPTQREVIKDVKQPTQDVAGIAEPSIYVPGQRGVTPTGIASPAAGRVVTDISAPRQPVGGEGVVGGALEAVEGLNPRQLKEYNDAKAQYLTNTANESVSAINRKYGAPKGDPMQLALDSLANDLYAKENTKLANRFFRGLPNTQRTYVEDKIAAFKQQERRGETEIARLDAMREQQAAIREEYGDQAAEDFMKDTVSNDPDATQAEKVQSGVEGKTAADAASWIANNAPDADYRYIAGRVSERLKQLEKAGIKFNFKVVHIGNQAPVALNGNARGYTHFTFGGEKTGTTVNIWLNGADVTGRVGMSYETVLHELIHAATTSAIRLGRYEKSAGTNFGKSVDRLIDVSNAIIRQFNEKAKSGQPLTDFEQRILNGQNTLENEREILTWALTNREAQQYLESIQYKNSPRSIWSALVDAIRGFLNLSANANTALNEILYVADEILSADIADVKQVAKGLNTSMQQMAGTAKQQAEELYNATGAKASPPPKGAFQTIKETTPAEAKNAVKQFLNRAETMYFSSDAALSNRIRQELEKNNTDWEVLKDMMLQVSTSQALHADAVANVFLEHGDIEYDPNTFKFMAKDSKDSWQGIIKQLSNIATKYDIEFNDMSKYARKALEAKRLKGLKKTKPDAYSHMNDDQIAAGMKLYEVFPELNALQDSWNGVRKNAMKVAVDSGLYTEEQAKDLLDFMDYVPFYRVEQLMANAGPKEYSRGLLDFAKGYKYSGSEQEVDDIFDNMERWVSYTVSRAVKNRTALNMKNTALELMPDEVRQLRQDAPVKKEQNTIDIWEDGVKKKYEFDDPLFIHAFEGSQPVSLPILKTMASVSNILRKNIVLNPLFSISQLSQDSIGAMFTSGLKQPFKLPGEVVKEFIKTLRGTSATAKELAKYGAVGQRDYSAAIARNDAEITAGLKAPSKFQKFLAPFEKFAMASDNAVRQAVYNRTLAEGGDKATAVEKAFEIINFKRGGASGNVTALRQVVPFFGAYLQAQNVAFKTVMGKGISPTEKAAARRTLLATTAKVAALGFIYAALCADDDEYQKMDPTIRDRHLLIPGTGFMLPLRSDVFLLPKLAAEYTYQGITDQGFTDGKKMRRGMKDAILNAILSPTVVPQAGKPLLEVMTNYNFFTGRPLIGQGLENKVTAEQFTNTTSELAKFLGKAGLMSPITIDHLIRGYTGTTGGLGLMAINKAVNLGSDTPAPEKSWQDTLASTPGLSAFVAKEHGSGIKNDFYELRGEVDKAVNTFNNMKKTGRVEDAKEFFQENKQLFAVKTQVNNIERQLAKLRAEEKRIYAAPEKMMSAEQKGLAIERLKQIEDRMLRNVEMLREKAGY